MPPSPPSHLQRHPGAERVARHVRLLDSERVAEGAYPGRQVGGARLGAHRAGGRSRRSPGMSTAITSRSAPSRSITGSQMPACRRGRGREPAARRRPQDALERASRLPMLAWCEAVGATAPAAGPPPPRHVVSRQAGFAKRICRSRDPALAEAGLGGARGRRSRGAGSARRSPRRRSARPGGEEALAPGGEGRRVVGGDVLHPRPARMSVTRATQRAISRRRRQAAAGEDVRCWRSSAPPSRSRRGGRRS